MPRDIRYTNRKYIIGGIAVAVVLVYIIRLFALQITTDDYKRYADSNAFLKRTVYPARGNIYDRNGNLMVYNQPTYDLLFVPVETEGIDTLDLCSTLGITREEFASIMARVSDRRRNPGYSRYTQQLLMAQLSPEEAANFHEKLYKFNGFHIRRRTIRQ